MLIPSLRFTFTRFQATRLSVRHSKPTLSTLRHFLHRTLNNSTNIHEISFPSVLLSSHKFLHRSIQGIILEPLEYSNHSVMGCLRGIFRYQCVYVYVENLYDKIWVLRQKLLADFLALHLSEQDSFVP